MGLHSSELRLVSAGIDYLTLTTTSPATKSRMQSLFQAIASEDRAMGYKLVKGGAFGFYGQRTRHALLADKEDRAIMQVSGQQAQRSFKLMRPGDNCTRLDIQVTMQVTPGTVNQVLERLCAEVRSAPAIRGIRPKCKASVGDHGTETVYIGKRQSDIFIRCYDKFEESGKEEYRDTVRLEVEIKGKTAKALWNHCVEHGLGPGYLLGVLRTCLSRRGISLDWVEWPSESKAIPLKEKTSQERTRAWWKQQVAPSVARDVAEWGWYTAMSILFDRCLTDNDRTCIMNAVSLQWGN
jgi:hypothetical protein